MKQWMLSALIFGVLLGAVSAHASRATLHDDGTLGTAALPVSGSPAAKLIKVDPKAKPAETSQEKVARIMKGLYDCIERPGSDSMRLGTAAR